MANLPEFLKENIKTGFGTDGCYVCGTPDMFEVMSFGRLIQNVLKYNPSIVHSVKGSNVTDVFINGKHIMKDKQINGIDQKKISKEAITYSDKLIKKANLDFLRNEWINS